MKLSLPTQLVACAMLPIAMVSFQAAAQDVFPDKPITLIVPYSAGSAADIAARFVADKMGPELHTTIIILNKDGASGAIGTASGARALPDGYTVTLIGSPAVIAMSTVQNAGYDLQKDFTPIGGINEFYNVLIVNSKLGITSFRDFVDAVKKQPNRFNFATSGTTAPSDIGGRALAEKHHLEMAFIPYKGSTAALNAVAGGEADASILITSAALPFVQKGYISPLAIMGPKRTVELPNVPDMNESGAGVLTTGWTGLAVPKATPSERASKLNKALMTVLGNDGLRTTLNSSGGSALSGSSDEMRQLLADDIEQIRKSTKTFANK